MGTYLQKTILFWLFFVSLTSDLWGQASIIQVGVNNSCYPYEYLDENKKPAGFDIDLLRALAKETGLELQITTGKAYYNKEELEKGNLNMLAGMFCTTNKAEYLNFSMPYLIIDYSLFIKKGNKITSLAQLIEDESQRVIIENGNVLHDYLTARGISNDRILTVEEQSDALLIIQDSYSACAILPTIQGEFLAHRNRMRDIRAVGLPILPREYGFAVAKGDTALLNTLNAGLSRLKQNGVYKKIISRWFGKYRSYQTIYGNGTPIIVFFIVILIFLIVFIYFFMRLRLKKLTAENKDIYNELISSNKVLKNLYQSETLYKRIVEFSPFPTAMINKEGFFALTNKGFDDLFGKPQNNNESVNRWLKDSFINEQEQNNIKSQIFYDPKNLANKSGNTKTYRVTTKMDRIESVRLFFVSLANEQLLIFFYIEQDNHPEQISPSDSVKEARIPLNLPYFAYDIRSPMNIILGFSEMMRKEKLTLTEMRSFAGSIHQSAQLLMQLLQNMGTLIKMDSNELLVKHEFILVANLLHHIQQQYNGLISVDDNATPVKIKCSEEITPDLAISADYELVNQAILNILRFMMEISDNEILTLGCDFTEQAGIHFFIGLKMEDNAYQMLLQKANAFQNGSPEKLEAFTSGIDLGLYIGFSLMKVFGSIVNLSRHENGLVELSFELTGYSGKDSVAQNKTKEVVENLNQFNWEGKKILIADDNPMSMDYFKFIFKSTRAEIIQVKDGREAYENCRMDSQINLVLMDWLMPVMDGETSTKLIRQLRPDLPIISVTAFALSEERAKILESGCNAYYPKPVDKNELLNYIQCLFNQTQDEH